MKFLVLLLVLAVAIGWMLLRTRRKPDAGATAPVSRKEPAAGATAPMLACAHCGLHLPRPEAQFDAAGRAYCGAEHRDAGPR